MRIAANVVAVLSWGSLLAAVWCGYALPEATRPMFGNLLALVIVSLLVGTITPAYLLNLEERTRNTIKDNGARRGQP